MSDPNQKTQPILPEAFQRTLNESARLLQQNQAGEAASQLEPLHAQAPHNADVAINLGGAYILQQKWQRAVDVLRPAAEANKENAMLWANLGAAELGQLERASPEQQARAIRAYERALQANGQAPNVHYHLGLIYRQRDELMRALAFFQRATEVNPADNDARYWLREITAQIAEERGQGSDKAGDEAGDEETNSKD